MIPVRSWVLLAFALVGVGAVVLLATTDPALYDVLKLFLPILP